MNTGTYYQQTDETIINFVPFRKNNNNNNNNNKNNKYPLNFTTLRTIFICCICIATGLITYSTTLSSQVKSISFDIDNDEKHIKYSEMDENTMINLFEKFKTTYNKSYNSLEEEKIRFDIFRDFLQIIDQRNGNDTLAVHGITKFADLSNDEFKATFLGYKPLEDDTYINAKTKQVNSYDGNLTYVNWADIYTTPVKDQGYCGSCWAFSATEQIESDSIRLGLLTTSDALSPEQIVQCDSIDDGCNGGNTGTAFEYVRSAGGIETDAQYPYTSYYDVTGTCESNADDFVVTVDEYYSLSDEEAMISHIFSTGPIAICLDASSWSSYVSGIITTCGYEVDHCVQAVGINMAEGYWIVRNSWGTEWGNEGYIWLESGTNMCNIAYDPKYVEVSKV